VVVDDEAQATSNPTLVGDEHWAAQPTDRRQSERWAEISAKQSDQLIGDEVNDPNGPTSWSAVKSDC
jgi:hypothetical protein